jgi:HD-like signal output (HDOD) protein
MLDQQNLIRGAYQLQPLPMSVQRLAALADQPFPDLAEIENVVALDPVLTGRLLRMANSAANHRQHQAGTVKQAVMRMGSGLVLGLAMGASARPLVLHTLPGYCVSGDFFWEHAVTAALVAEVSRAFTKAPWSAAGFTAALLHDFGKLILGPYLTKDCLACLKDAIEEGGLEPFRAEYEVLSVHHAEVGALIAQHWKLPENIVQGILHHHDPEESSDVLARVTYFANTAAKWIQAEREIGKTERDILAPTMARLEIPADSLGKICTRVAARCADLKEHYR